MIDTDSPDLDVQFNLQEIFTLAKIASDLIEISFDKLHDETLDVLSMSAENNFLCTKDSVDQRLLAVIDPKIRKAKV